MVAKRKLTIETLTKLGRRKLAELLIAEAAGNRQLKQTLNLAIAAEAGPEVLGASLRKRLAADATRVSRTAWRSKVERLITLSTSAVAVCCSSDSLSSRLRA